MSRSSLVIRFSLVFLCFQASVGSAGPGGEEPRMHSLSQDSLQKYFMRANGYYEQGDYEKAIAQYALIVKSGVKDKDLFYNLGNAHYRNADLGRAVLFYERALRLAPREKDIRDNLSLVRSLIRDKQFVRKESWLMGALLWVHRRTSTKEALLLTSCLYFLLCTILVGYIFRDSRFVSLLYNRLSIVSPGRLFGLLPHQDMLFAVIVAFVFFAAAGVSSIEKVMEERRRSKAVVVDQEVMVYSGPSEESTLQFKIHEGTKVEVVGGHSRWARIDLPGGLSGWVSLGSIERI